MDIIDSDRPKRGCEVKC